MKRHSLLLAGTLVFPLTLGAQTFTWNGGGGNALWSNPANWAGGASPVDTGAWDTFQFGGTTQLTSDNDIGGGFGGWNANVIEFLAGAGAFTITDSSGTGLDMLGAASAAAADGDATITNNSSNLQTIDANLFHRSDFNTGLVFNATGGDITVNGNILNQGGSTDDVDIFGPNITKFTGTNTFQDPVRIWSGTLQLDGGSTIWDGGYVAPQAAGATLELLASETIGAFDGPAGSTVQLNGNTLTTGSRPGNRTFGGALLGTAASQLVKVGTQEIRFTTSSDLSGFGGTMDVTAGQVRVDAEAGDLSAFGNATAEIIVRSGGTLLGVSSNTGTYDVGQITLDGGQLKGAGGNHNRFNLIDVTANGGTVGRTETFDSQVRTNALTGTGDITIEGLNRNYWFVLQNTVDQTQFTGNYIVDGGRFVANTSELVNDKSNVNVINGGEFNIRGTETIGSLSGDATAVVGRGSGNGNIHLLTGMDNTSTTYAGEISDEGGAGSNSGSLELTKMGTGTFMVTSPTGLTYTGDTNVDDGVLMVSNGGHINGTDNVNVTAGAVLHLNDGDLTTGGTGLFSLGAAGELILEPSSNISVTDTTWDGTITDNSLMSDSIFTEGDGTLASSASAVLNLGAAGNVFDLVGALDLSAGGTLMGFDTLTIPGAPTSGALSQNIFEVKLAEASGGITGSFASTVFPTGSEVAPGIGNLMMQGDYFVELRGNQLWLVAQVPEPSRATLLGLGILGIILRRRR